MSEITKKIAEKQAEIDELREESDALHMLMNEEIQEIEKKIKNAKENIEDLQENIKELQIEYNRGEAQIVSLQYSIETARKTLKSNLSIRNELEIVNDNWENSIRSLEFYNSQLESQLQEAENYVLNLNNKVNSTTIRTKEDLSQLESQNQEIRKLIRNKSRSPSPIHKPPVPPKNSIIVSKVENINIINKPNIEDSANIVVVTPDKLYINDKSVVFKDKSVKKIFEFKKVVKKSNFCDEVKVVCDNFLAGKNCCVVISDENFREKSFFEVCKKISDFLLGKNAEVNCVEIKKEVENNLLGMSWKKVVIGKELENIVQVAYSHLSLGRNHLLLTIKIDHLCLQILDLGKVNEDQDLSESLSLNASLFFLEELMINLSKNQPNFSKSLLTQKLHHSLSSNYFLQYLLHFESPQDLPVLSLAARLQSIFSRSQLKHEQNFRSLDLLEKERLSNFHILRLIEKSQKDLALLKRESKLKDLLIESLQKDSKQSSFIKRQSSFSPNLSPKYMGLSKIPLPRPIRK